MRWSHSDRTLVLFAILALIALLPAIGEAVQPVSGSCPVAPNNPQSVAINVRYQGTMPERVRMESPGRRDICLRPDPDGGRFYGAYPTPSPARLFGVNVVAEFRGGDRTAIPLHLGFRTEPLAFTLPRPGNGPCLDRLVQGMSRDLGSRDAALAAAFQARHWFHATSGCPPSSRVDVARVWFDRSYEAAILEPAFPLDMAAARALSELPTNDPRRRDANRRHVQERLNQYALSDARRRYALQLELGERGFALDAIQMSDSIAAAIAGDPATANLYRRVGINLDRLEKDRNFYINRSGIDEATADALLGRASPDAARVQMLVVDDLARIGGPTT